MRKTTSLLYIRSFAVFLYIVVGFFGGFRLTHASNIEISPAVLDKRAQIRDIFHESLTITNRGPRRIQVYPTVNNLLAEGGLEPFKDPSRADISSSFANWISVSRGAITLDPGEKKEIPFDINVNVTAKPGLYHALISFPEGYSRNVAEIEVGTVPAIALNLEVYKEVKQNVEVHRFMANRRVVLSGLPSFSYEIENLGNQSESPRGNIFIYDNRGKELAMLDASKEALVLPAGSKKNIEDIAWSGGTRFGHYKALLDFSYGINGNEKVQDTLFFWVVPWKLLLLIIMATGIGATILFTWVHARYEAWHRNRAEKKWGTPRVAPRPILIKGNGRYVVDLRDSESKISTS